MQQWHGLVKITAYIELEEVQAATKDESEEEMNSIVVEALRTLEGDEWRHAEVDYEDMSPEVIEGPTRMEDYLRGPGE